MDPRLFLRLTKRVTSDPLRLTIWETGFTTYYTQWPNPLFGCIRIWAQLQPSGEMQLPIMSYVCHYGPLHMTALRLAIMACVSSPAIQISWNGELTDVFLTGRGILPRMPVISLSLYVVHREAGRHYQWIGCLEPVETDQDRKHGAGHITSYVLLTTCFVLWRPRLLAWKLTPILVLEGEGHLLAPTSLYFVTGWLSGCQQPLRQCQLLTQVYHRPNSSQQLWSSGCGANSTVAF